MSSSRPDPDRNSDDVQQSAAVPRRRREDRDREPADRRSHEAPRRHSVSETAEEAASALAAGTTAPARDESGTDTDRDEGTAGGEDRRAHEDRRAQELHGRRASDEHPADGSVGGRRAGDVFRRFRQPLIGLGLAGLAIPMVQATTEEAPDATPETEPADDETVAARTGDMEENLVGRIAETQEDAARTKEVDAAVSRYGIGRDLAEDIYDAARENNIEPKLAYGLVKTESTFDERAISHVGARGLTQVMPKTAAWLVPGTRTEDLFDRKTNLALGFRYLNQLVDKYDGDVRLALLAYNRGPGTVDKVLKRGGNPDNGYADKVLRG